MHFNIKTGDATKMEEVGFEHLHLHSDHSLLDGYGKAKEYAERWKQHGDYLCISDHGMLACVPDQITACEPSREKDDADYLKRSLNPIFGSELYVNPGQVEYASKEEWAKHVKAQSPEDAKKLRKSYHLLAIAYNETGYKNLVQLTSLAWIKGYYYKPRVNHEQLKAHKEGLYFTSCCYSSEIGQAFDKGGDEAGFAMVEKYLAMFGDNFRLEIMLLDFDKQKPYDIFILKAHAKYKIPVILTNDCHFSAPEDSHYQHLMLMQQTGKTIQGVQKAMADDAAADVFVLQDKNLWMKTEGELNAKYLADYADAIDYDIYKQAKLNTVEICRSAKGVKLDRSNKLPRIPDADEKLKEYMVWGLKKRGLKLNAEYRDRLKEEYELICRKDFSSYFLIQKMMTDEARRICPELLGWGDGSEAVGPGRGSACGSLICYCLGITDVDPIKHDLLFSRFMSESRGGKQLKLKFTGQPLRQDAVAV